MENSLYNKQHLREYFMYGLAASVAFSIPVLVFFFIKDYNQLGLIFVGVILFLFVIMQYALKLSRRRPEYKSAWMMIIATHLAVVTGIVLSVLFTTLLCFFFIPYFLSGNSPDVLKDSPAGQNDNNWSMLALIYLCATVANFGAGGFIAILGPYVFKKNQTKDKTAELDAEIKVGN